MSTDNKQKSDDEFDFIEPYPNSEQKETDKPSEHIDDVETRKHKLSGVKHLIQCHCILPHFKKTQDPIFHQFVVFSIIDNESDTVITKFAECNNCGAAHKIIDICKSEIIIGRDEVPTQLTCEDFQYSLPNDLFNLFVTYNREVADFEHAQFILDNEQWDSHVILSREELEDYVQGKLVRFISDQKFRVESYIIRNTI